MIKTIQQTEEEIKLTGSDALVYLEVMANESGIKVKDIVKNINTLCYRSIVKILQKLNNHGVIKRIPNFTDMRSPLWVINNDYSNTRCTL